MINIFCIVISFDLTKEGGYMKMYEKPVITVDAGMVEGYASSAAFTWYSAPDSADLTVHFSGIAPKFFKH